MHLVHSGFIQLEGLFGLAVLARVIQSFGLMHMSIRHAKAMLALLTILSAPSGSRSRSLQAMPPVVRTYSDDSSDSRQVRLIQQLHTRDSATRAISVAGCMNGSCLKAVTVSRA